MSETIKTMIEEMHDVIVKQNKNPKVTFELVGGSIHTYVNMNGLDESNFDQFSNMLAMIMSGVLNNEIVDSIVSYEDNEIDITSFVQKITESFHHIKNSKKIMEDSRCNEEEEPLIPPDLSQQI